MRLIVCYGWQHVQRVSVPCQRELDRCYEVLLKIKGVSKLQKIFLTHWMELKEGRYKRQLAENKWQMKRR